jgi:hypothetical protein
VTLDAEGRQGTSRDSREDHAARQTHESYFLRYHNCTLPVRYCSVVKERRRGRPFDLAETARLCR